MLNMCDLFEDNYKEFVLGELTDHIYRACIAISNK